MPIFKTERELDRFPTPTNGKDVILTDSTGSGVRVRISGRTGARSFLWEGRLPGRRHATRVRLKAFDLKSARQEALKIRASQGSELVAETPAFVDVARLVEEYGALTNQSGGIRRLLDRHIVSKFGTRVPGSILPIEVTRWHAGFTKTVGKGTERHEVPAPHIADKALAMFRAAINWGKRQRLIDKATDNPCESVEPNFEAGTNERHYPWCEEDIVRLGQVLARWEAEIRALTFGANHTLRHADSGGIIAHYPRIEKILLFKFLALTGLRKSNALKLEWSQDHGTYLSWDTPAQIKLIKKKRKFYKTVSTPVRAILDELRALAPSDAKYVFPGTSDPTSHMADTGFWYKIREEAGLFRDGLWARPHDLRHLFGDTTFEAGLTEKATMALMGHATAAMSSRYSKGEFRVHAENEERVGQTLAAKLLVIDVKAEEAA